LGRNTQTGDAIIFVFPAQAHRAKKSSANAVESVPSDLLDLDQIIPRIHASVNKKGCRNRCSSGNCKYFWTPTQNRAIITAVTQRAQRRTQRALSLSRFPLCVLCVISVCSV
jgi:hypothetical protein